MIRVFKSDGEGAAGVVVTAIQDKAESARRPLPIVYTLCERAGWAGGTRAHITESSQAGALLRPPPLLRRRQKRTTLFG